MRIPQNQNRIGLYLRVSSEEQAERETIEAQRQALAHWVQLHRVNVIQEYADNGVSGTLPLSMRPQGKLLLEAAKQRRFDAVVVYSVDRLVRSLSVLMEVYAQLSEWGVDIKSATEPFDTSTPFGRFLFQFLGSMAEFQRSAILERLVMGRDRIVREGKWTHGPVPFGYELDEDQRLALSTRKIDGTGQTEAEYVRGLFQRLAQGSTLVAEASRLNSLKVPTTRRYASGTESQVCPC